MAGRGRGRGRGIALPETRPGETSGDLKPAKIQSEETKQPIPEPKLYDFEELCGEFKVLKVTSSQDEVKDLVQKAKDSTKTDENFSQIIEILYQNVFKDNETAEIAAQVGSQLSSLEGIGGKFRSCLLKRAQDHYKNRENLSKDSLSEWTGLLSLLCEIFRVLKISGQPFKPLAGPISEMMGEILLNVDDGVKIECFYQNFKNVGKMLQAIDKTKMEFLMCKIRDSIISEQSNPETRCMLIELLELHASNWILNQDVQRFYCDAMADILALQG
ncbi:CBP80/20-dependent translation initiation factor-like [Actinia tenebrosa]|uniref:CBP80/20-dependent translation initiation factor-like n=1 Tax=Actinia tenebrosa TaxID=6105 RepID=A0A6P8IZQ3_ACTTE|nr:CBP80/20-dependent translation initiation factor-like [Actinia tenebrosa]